MKVSKPSTRKKVSITNLKDAQIAEGLENNREVIAEAAEEASAVAIGGNNKESESSPLIMHF